MPISTSNASSLLSEVVEHPDGGNGHEQTDGGGDQRFRNTGRHRAETGRLFGRDAFERVDDADDGAEQSDERSGRTDGRQAADAALQFGVNDGFGTVESALGSFDLFTRNFALSWCAWNSCRPATTTLARWLFL